jgi:hypothetical protein
LRTWNVRPQAHAKAMTDCWDPELEATDYPSG